MQKYFSLAVVVAFGTMLLSVSPAYAYLDPGTGSMIVQVIIGALVGMAAAIKIYWFKIKSFFKRAKQNSDNKTD